jgi:hypothetical protein
MEGKEFLDLQKENMDVLGFWDEDNKSSILRCIESRYQRSIIKDWGISDVIINGDKVLLKWFKRPSPMTNEEIIKKYGN